MISGVSMALIFKLAPSPLNTVFKSTTLFISSTFIPASSIKLNPVSTILFSIFVICFLRRLEFLAICTN
tara:strand:+ start:2408 stop:2614 length:207 start_codon:yes stop_codon:yes gene_type:complete